MKLIGRLWKRHGREDIALAAILLSNLDHKGMGTDPWSILQQSINPMESVDSLLLNIEELFRAKRQPPNDEQIFDWINGRKIEQHMSLIVIYSGLLHGHKFSSELIEKIMQINIPVGDSILTRIKSKISSLEISPEYFPPISTRGSPSDIVVNESNGSAKIRVRMSVRIDSVFWCVSETLPLNF